MSNQNIYDNQKFFDEYKKLRDKKSSANITIEKPNLFSLLPSLKNKVVLDLGCGYGENCIEFIHRGATRVFGLDISEKMLEVAKKENYSNNISYIQKSMTELRDFNEKVDLVVSSLAIHYIEDFSQLVHDVYNCLNDDGYFIFSQEHPFSTSSTSSTYWTKDDNGQYVHFNLNHYGLEGKREVSWLVDNVVKYHRTISSLINTLVDRGFIIEKFLEPQPSKQVLHDYPNYQIKIHKPDFLFIKARKK